MMERRMRGNSHVRCGVGEKVEITSKSYLSPSLGGAQGQATDILISARNIERCRKRLTEELAKNCHQTYDKVFADTERDNFLSAEEALEYGLVDKIL